jgi:putative membrane protein
MIRNLVFAGLILAATPAFAQSSSTAVTYVPAAGAADLYEKMSSQLVLEGAKSADVRMFAQMMISDHSMTTAQIVAAAKASGLQPAAPKLMPKQAKMIADLRAAPVAKREKLYLDQQVMAHQDALALHQSYAASGDKPALVKAAASAVPIVQRHLDEVQRLDAAAM